MFTGELAVHYSTPKQFTIFKILLYNPDNWGTVFEAAVRIDSLNKHMLKTDVQNRLKYVKKCSASGDLCKGSLVALDKFIISIYCDNQNEQCFILVIISRCYYVTKICCDNDGDMK